MKMLAVEDDVAIRHLLPRILELNGYEVTIASNAKEALEKFKEEKFDVVLTDYHMPPGMNGVSLAEAIKAINPKTPVVLMSGHPPDQKPQCVDLLLMKPLRKQERALIDELVSRQNP